MSPATLKSTLKLSPSSAAAKRVFDRALNKRKKKVKFCKIIHKKNITPLDSKIKRRSFGEYFDGGDPALSFTELTDHSIQSFGNKQTSAERINSPVIEVVLKRQRRRSNLFLKMSGSNSSIKTFFSPRPIKRSVPSMPDNEDAEVLFVNEVINTQKTSSSDHSSSKEPVVISLSDSTLEESVIIDPIVTRPTPKLWIDAFIPKKKSDIIHGPPMDIFIEWLKCWKKRLILLAKLENEPPKKKRKSRKHEEDSDYEPEKETDELCSTFVLSGPTGCGKTSFVHFLAKEYGFDVIELSASDERSGATMRNKLQGALENFAVRGPGDIRSSMIGAKKSKESGVKHNLILIDDADIVFKSDTSFWTKLGAFSVESKIPIVLTCTDRHFVICNMENSEFEGENFLKREKKVISRHLKQWISDYADVTIDANLIATTINESKQDIRKALNNLEFNGGKLFITENPTFPKFSLSSKSLAELDCILTKCNEFEKKSKTRWNARILSNIDYIPDKCPIQTCDIPGVDNNNEYFINDITNLLSSSLPASFEELNKKDERLSTNLQSCRGIYAPILTAVYDTFKRCEPGASIRNVALYELPILSAIHRGWSERIKNQPSRRRVLHPFNDVRKDNEKALDRLGKLHTTIDQYCTWS